MATTFIALASASIGVYTAGAAETLLEASGSQGRTAWMLDPAAFPAFAVARLYGAYSSPVTYTIRARLSSDVTSAANATGTVVLEAVLPPASFPTAFAVEAVMDLPAVPSFLKLCHLGNAGKVQTGAFAITSTPPLLNPPLGPRNLIEPGDDIDVTSDLRRDSFTLAAGIRNIGNALARRLITPRGALTYDPSYGTDIRAYVNAGMTAQRFAQIASDVAAEVLKDFRLQAVDVDVTLGGPSSIDLALLCDLAQGPFELVFRVDQLSVALLTVNSLEAN